MTWSGARARQWLALAVVLVGAAVLRLYGLDIQSLWNDELSALTRGSYAHAGDMLRLGMQNEPHPPGYNLLLHFVQRSVGDSSVAIRMPSAIAGIVAVGVMFLLGSRFYTAKEGIIAAALMAVLWVPNQDSQDARPYALLLLLALLSTCFWIDFIEALQRRERVALRRVAPYVACATALVYLHHFGLLLVALQGLAAFVILRSSPLRTALFAGYGAIAVAYLPWLPRLFSDLETTRLLPEMRLVDFFHYLSVQFNMSATNALVVMALFAPWVLRDSDPSDRPRVAGVAATRMLSAWLLAPLLFAWLVPMLGIAPNLRHFRALVIALPPVYLLVARAITRLPGGQRTHILASTLLIGYFLFGLVFQIGYYSRPYKQQFREAVQFVAGRLDDPGNERSAIIGCAWSARYLDYYLEKLHPSRRVDLLACDPEDADGVLAHLDRAQPDVVWYVVAARQPSASVLDALNERRSLATHQAFYGADVWVFRGP